MAGAAPFALLGLAFVHSGQQQILGMSSLAFGLLLIAAGVVAYGIKEILRHSGLLAVPENPGAA